MLLLGSHGTTKKNLYPKLSNKKNGHPLADGAHFFASGKFVKEGV